MPERQPGRNDRCPCGSGKKFKRCCIDQAQDSGARRPPAEAFTYADLSPYTICKMIEDEEMLKRQPLHVQQGLRNFWTPSKIAVLTTEEILQRLAAFGILVTEENYRHEAKGRSEAWGISDRWARASTKTVNKSDRDFLGLPKDV